MLQGRPWVLEGRHHLGVPFLRTGLLGMGAKSPVWLLGAPSHSAGLAIPVLTQRYHLGCAFLEELRLGIPYPKQETDLPRLAPS